MIGLLLALEFGSPDWSHLVQAADQAKAIMVAAPYAVRPEPGLVCMIVPGAGGMADRDGSTLPRLYPQPSAASDPIAVAGSIVLAVSPPHVVNGFVEVRQFDKTSAWIKQDAVQPYHSDLDPHARCTPVLRSDGALGFGR